MLLTVTKADGSVQKLNFGQGPIYIGRQLGSQVFLPDVRVSRQHAVIYADQAGSWALEDTGSSNKTFLNQRAIHKTPIKDGDKITIADFTIQITLADSHPMPQPTPHMEDTVVTTNQNVEIHYRNLIGTNAPPLKIPAARIKDLPYACSEMCRATSVNQLHLAVIDIMLRHFSALHAWVGIRKQPEGPMDFEDGRMVSRQFVKRSDIVMQQIIEDALEKKKYSLVPTIPRQLSAGKIRSAMAGPIVKDDKCFGLLYVDNATEHGSYNEDDLDYLILLSVHISTMLEHIQHHPT